MYRLSPQRLAQVHLLATLRVDEMIWFQGDDTLLQSLWHFVKDYQNGVIKDPRATPLNGRKFRTLRSLRRDLSFNDKPKLYIIRVK